MTLEERPRQAAEPETTFEPAAAPENEAEQTATRRAVNLASHAGVGVAGAGGVVVVQQLTRSGGGDSVSSAEALDVFQDAGDPIAQVEPRGVSADAEPVIRQSTTTAGSVAQPIAGDPAQVQPETSQAELPPAVEAATFSPPVAAGAEHSNSFAPLTEEIVAPAQPDGPPESLEGPGPDVEELERETYLASAEVEVGGGFSAVPDDDGTDSIFGASSEYGSISLDDHLDDTEDEDDLASTP
jgi:hypothetical protein